MPYNEAPPFPRGMTYAASDDLSFMEGRMYEFADTNPNTGIPNSTNRVVCRLTKNTAAIALLPKRLATAATGANLGKQTDGYVTTTAARIAGVVDEYLPTAGVAVNGYYWLVVKGPATVLTDLAGGANNLLPADTALVALTAATSGATTAGRVAPQDLTGATALLGNQLQNILGFAISARTTANTNSDIRAFVTTFLA